MKIARPRWSGIEIDRIFHKSHLWLAVLAAMLALAVACGGSSGGSNSNDKVFVQVHPSDTIYTLDDLKRIGYKVSKTYKVEGLVNATNAYYGFWSHAAGTDPTDYEIRFYASHADAVASGTAQAEEATGDDAVLDRALATWTEGLTDRRRVVGPGASQATGQPRYPDYVILGNMIALCEGRNLEDAQDRCNDLVAALTPPGS